MTDDARRITIPTIEVAGAKVEVEFSRTTQFESDYATLMDRICEKGTSSNNRTGIDTRKLFGGNVLTHDCQESNGWDSSRQFDLVMSILEAIGNDRDVNNYMCNICPILTNRPIKFDVAWYETLMFLRGITDTTYLEDRGISIWKGNTTREFLDGRGLTDLPEKDLGKGYGYQWRNWNDELDQLDGIIEQMRQDPMSRRHVVSAWNPLQNPQAALDPCHILYQFNIEEGETVFDEEDDFYVVDIQFYMRSSDLLFGLPFNILSYYLILNIVCGYLTTVTGTRHIPGRVHYVSGDSHVYENQIEYIEEYLDRVLIQEARSLRDWNRVSRTPQITPMLALPQHDFDENLLFNDYLIWVEEQGYTLFYEGGSKMTTPRPKMAV